MKYVLRTLVVAFALLTASATSAWAIAYNGEEPPAGPPADASPPVTEVATPPAVAAPASGLPVTGGDVLVLAGVGAGAVLAGAVLVAGRRRLAATR